MFSRKIPLNYVILGFSLGIITNIYTYKIYKNNENSLKPFDKK